MVLLVGVGLIQEHVYVKGRPRHSVAEREALGQGCARMVKQVYGPVDEHVEVMHRELETNFRVHGMGYGKGAAHHRRWCVHQAFQKFGEVNVSHGTRCCWSTCTYFEAWKPFGGQCHLRDGRDLDLAICDLDLGRRDLDLVVRDLDLGRMKTPSLRSSFRVTARN